MEIFNGISSKFFNASVSYVNLIEIMAILFPQKMAKSHFVKDLNLSQGWIKDFGASHLPKITLIFIGLYTMLMISPLRGFTLEIIIF